MYSVTAFELASSYALPILFKDQCVRNIESVPCYTGNYLSHYFSVWIAKHTLGWLNGADFHRAALPDLNKVNEAMITMAGSGAEPLLDSVNEATETAGHEKNSMMS